MILAKDEVRRLNLFTNITTCAVVEWTPMQRALHSNHTEVEDHIFNQVGGLKMK